MADAPVPMTLPEAARIMRESVLDRRYEETMMGSDVQEYIRYKTLSSAARTIDQYERDIARMAVLLAHLGITEVSTPDLLVVLESFPARSRRRARAAIAGFWKWALASGRIERDPMTWVPTFKQPAVEVHDIFSAEEQGRLIDATRRMLMPEIQRARVYLLLDTGMRGGGARNLRVQDVNLTDRVVTLHEKGDKKRLVPLRGDVCLAFEQYLQTPYPKLDFAPRQSDYVWFPNGGTDGSILVERGYQVTWLEPATQLAASSFWRWWNRVTKEAGVRYRKPHMTRHTYVTDLIDAGVDLHTAKELAGHSSTSVTEQYVHSSRTRLQGAVEKLTEMRTAREPF
jgi:integrase/recombinase XerD